MKKLVLILASAMFAVGANAQTQDCSDLFISEYVVGSYNNRALEIYNPTDAAIDLSGYKVGRFRDGAGTPMLLGLAGMIQPYSTYVVVVDKRDPNGTGFEAPVDMALQAVADTFVNPVYVQSDSPFYFNGDDAVPLTKADGTTLVDLIGKIGEDPGTAWSDTSGTWWTTNHTLIRKHTVLHGVTTNPLEFMVQTEWDSLPEDTFTELGWHTCDCQTMGVSEVDQNKFNVYPNPSADKDLMVSAAQELNMIQVYNILGQESHRVSFNGKNTTTHKLKLQHLSTGVYIVRVSLRNGAVLSRKVMLGK
ncbi:MAG: T9SS type A sorting domain-containing protein [Flavobacteriales bacterium]|nr:T9SS type A sorting domain-containing protein [Flavobacteriales bacterium]